MLLYLLEYAISLSSNDDIINRSGFTSNNVSVSKTTDAIVDINGSTKNLDSQTVPDEISINHNDFKIKEYIEAICMYMFASWKPKLVMEVCIISQKCKYYNIIKHINDDISYIIYFDYLVKDGYNGDGYSLFVQQYSYNSF